MREKSGEGRYLSVPPFRIWAGHDVDTRPVSRLEVSLECSASAHEDEAEPPVGPRRCEEEPSGRARVMGWRRGLIRNAYGTARSPKD